MQLVQPSETSHQREKLSRVAIGYTRVSTDKQADHGVSLLAQAAKINAMASVQDVTLSEIITEGGESAKNIHRPGLQRLRPLPRS